MTSQSLSPETSPKPSTGHPRFKTAYAQATELQKLLMERARTGDEKSLVLAGIARAFCELEETKRKLKMRPLPKSVDVTKTPKVSRSKPQGSPSFTEA